MARQQKESRNYDRVYDFMRLDRRDLQQLVEILGADAEPVRLESEDYKYDTLDEVIDHFATRPLIELQFQTEAITLTLGRKFSMLQGHPYWTKGGAGSVIQRCSAIDDLLRRRVRFVGRTSLELLKAVAVSAVSLGIAFLILGVLPHVASRFSAGTVPGAALVFVGGVAMLYCVQVYGTLLVLHERNEAFLVRHRESLIVSVITAGIVGLFSYLIQSARDQPVQAPIPAPSASTARAKP